MASAQLLTFATVLRRHRLAAGLSQEELAERAGLSRTGVSELERGIKRAPYKDTVTRLADALQLNARERAIFEAAARGRALQNLAPGLHASPSSPAEALPAGRLPLPPLVGRQRELAALERHLTPGTDTPPLLLLAGEPGIGKSRLLAEAATQARAVGWHILAGGCIRRSGQEAYEPFVGVLARAIRSTPSARQQLDLHGSGWLVRLLPELLETAVVPTPTWTLSPEQERRLMFAAVARYLANVAGPAGTLLLLDDLQWAGADALDMLVSLVCSTAAEGAAGQQRLRVVGAYRSTEVDAQHPLAIQFPDLARDGLVQQAPIGPLAPVEAEALLVALLEAGTDSEGADSEGTGRAAVVERIVQRAGGVPYFLVSCAQALRARAADEQGPATIAAVPWDTVQSIRQQAAALGPAAHEVLQAAAVVGRVVPHALLAAVSAHAGRTERETVSALEAAERARLLIAADEGPTLARSPGYQFAHDLIREAILAELPAARRIMLHRMVAEAIEQLPEPERAPRGRAGRPLHGGGRTGARAAPYGGGRRPSPGGLRPRRGRAPLPHGCCTGRGAR